MYAVATLEYSVTLKGYTKYIDGKLEYRLVPHRNDLLLLLT